MTVSSCYLVGLYPRTDELVRAMRRMKQSKASEEEVIALAREESRGVVKVQEEAGMSVLIDGQLLWNDLFRPFVERLEGIEAGALARWFDNNMFYRQPRIVGEVRSSGPILDGYIFAQNLVGRNGKIVLPDPYTMARLSENRYYRRFDDLVLDIAEAMSAELGRLRGNKWLRMVQLSAPSIVAEKMDKDRIEVFSESVRKIRKAVSGVLSIHTFFYDFSRALPWILDAGADVLGLDLTASRLSEIGGYDIETTLCLGIVDSRNSYVERAEEIARTARLISEKLDLREVHISPTADLDFLPRRVADAKVKELGRARRILGGEE